MNPGLRLPAVTEAAMEEKRVHPVRKIAEPVHPRLPAVTEAAMEEKRLHPVRKIAEPLHAR